MKNRAFDRQHWLEYIKYGGLAALAYIAACFGFIKHGDFDRGWELFMGNFFFMFVMFGYSFILTRRQAEGKSTVSMLTSGQMATVVGVALSLLLMGILVLVYVPDVLKATPSTSSIKNPPAQMLADKNNGLLSIIFANAGLGNYVAGAFITLIISYAAKQNQTKDKPAEL